MWKDKVSTISTGFDKAEKQRFHNLLKLAAESPFEGERDAALAAAGRLAKKHDMDLREAAAASEPEPEPKPKPHGGKDFWGRAAARGWDGSGFEPPPGFEERAGKGPIDGDPTKRTPEDEKRRWRAAFDAARRRGLDDAEEAAAAKPKPRRASQQPKSNRRMNPQLHAESLLRETSFPLDEIAHITKLTVHQVAAIKLKLRNEKKRPRRARA
ncbi:MAG: DUF2786 domain-containing protein [Alphaproteobacteria bacterium]